MAKVVYNTCFGGFGLSREAVLLARELSGDPNWGGPCIKGDVYEGGQVVKYDNGGCYDIKRTDEILVQVVETLGDKASGQFAELRITTVPSGTRYRIDDYDGRESVRTVSDYDWEVAD